LEDTAVEADGDVTVLSNVQHKGVRNYAISGAKAKGVKDGGTTAALSAGVAFALHKQNSRAWIGEGAGVTGQGVGVDARTDLPISDDGNDAFVAIYDDSKDIYDDLGLSFADVVGGLTKLPDVRDDIKDAKGELDVKPLYNKFLTGGANATADDAEKLSLAGAVNLFFADSETSAWIADGADVRATGSGADWSVTAGDDNSDFHFEREFDHALAITADTRTASVHGAGNFAQMIFGTSADSGGTSVGGSLSWVDHAATTVAGVGHGVHLQAPNIGIHAQDR